MPEATIEQEFPPVSNRPITPGLIGADDVANFLQVSVKTVRNLDSRGLIPRSRLNLRTPRWSLAELEAWARAGCPPRGQWEPVWARMGREKG